jgi:hypothetical protein
LVWFLTFKCHSSVTVQMARGNGTSFRAVATKGIIGNGKVGDGARAGKLSSALMTGRTPASAA